MAKYKDTLKEQLLKNQKDTFREYENKHGTDPDGAYLTYVKDAKAALGAESSADGGTLSALGERGLLSSGYEEYLKSLDERYMMSKYAEALHKKQLSEYQNRHGYESYLSSFDSLQRKISESVIKELSDKGEMSYEKAIALAVGSGLDEDHAAFAARSGSDAARKNTILKAIDFANTYGLSPYKAKLYASKLGLSDEDLDEVYRAVGALSDRERSKFASMSTENYLKFVEDRLKAEREYGKQ